MAAVYSRSAWSLIIDKSVLLTTQELTASKKGPFVYRINLYRGVNGIAGAAYPICCHDKP